MTLKIWWLSFKISDIIIYHWANYDACPFFVNATALNFKETLKNQWKLYVLAFISSGFFGGSNMYRYTYDLQTGTSHYRRNDGTVDSWQTPQKRGNRIRGNSISNKIASSKKDGRKIAFSLCCFFLISLKTFVQTYYWIIFIFWRCGCSCCCILFHWAISCGIL